MASNVVYLFTEAELRERTEELSSRFGFSPQEWFDWLTDKKENN